MVLGMSTILLLFVAFFSMLRVGHCYPIYMVVINNFFLLFFFFYIELIEPRQNGSRIYNKFRHIMWNNNNDYKIVMRKYYMLGNIRS